MPKDEFLNPDLKQAFIRLIAKRTGLEIREKDQDSFVHKISLRMNALRLLLPENYYQFLNSETSDSEREWFNIATLLTNTDSHFFRDKEQFNLLQNHIFPELIQRNRTSKTLRICSVGCSTGEEPYSLAILLEKLIPDIKSWNILILGVDINQDAIQKAREGIYNTWSFRGVQEGIKQNYFKLVDKKYHISQEIKKMVDFQVLNLVRDLFPQKNSELRNMDLILCRNVFIYFEIAAIATVLKKFYNTLQPLGYLLTGHTELAGQNLEGYLTTVYPESLVYQRPPASTLDPSSASIEFNLPENQENMSLEEKVAAYENTFETNNIKMQHTTLDLLKQLPPDTRIKRLGNLTAAELIMQFESEFKHG